MNQVYKFEVLKLFLPRLLFLINSNISQYILSGLSFIDDFVNKNYSIFNSSDELPYQKKLKEECIVLLKASIKVLYNLILAYY